MKLLEGKIAIVTGAGSGIGVGIAEVLAEHGACVAAFDINYSAVAETVMKIEQAGHSRGLAVQCDITCPDSVQDGVRKVIDSFDQIDILVNNAGILIPELVIDFPLEDFQKVFKINVEGTFLMSQAVARLMIQQGKGGSIISVASCAANKADLKHAAYSASKSAVITFSRVMALELGQYNIRCNCILPGATETPMIKHVCATIPGMREELLSKTALGKFAVPRDQANGVVFLASDLASHITGEYLVISGGEFMNA